MKEKGSNIADMKETRSYIADMKETGSNIADMKETGSNIADMKETGSNNADMKETGSNIVTMKETGSNNVDMKETGSNIADMKETGSNIADMKETGSKLPQFLAGVLANFSSLAAGCVMGWTSPILPRLKKADSFLVITEDEASWIGSLLLLGAAVGAFSGGFFADKIGRKWTLWSLSVPFILSWLLIMFAQSIAMIYAARIIAGLALGSLCAVVPMYVGEIAEDSIRGSLGSLYCVIITVGFFYVYIFGAFVSYFWLAIAGIVLPCIFAITFFFMPESPYYLLSRGKKEEANKALQWLRRKTSDGVATELEQMQKSVEESNKLSGSLKDLFTTRGNIKALYLTCGLIIFLQCGGINAVLFYATDIFQEAGGSLNYDISTIIIGAVFMVSGFIPLIFIDRVGRRVLIFISVTGIAIVQIIMGLFSYLKTHTDMDLSSVEWLPILCIVGNLICFCIGIGSVPFALMSEIFPTNVKGLATSITASCSWVFGFIVTKLFPLVVTQLGTHAAFWIFAGFCLLADIFVYFLLPETKGKSLQEIQDILNKKK